MCKKLKPFEVSTLVVIKANIQINKSQNTQTFIYLKTIILNYTIIFSC